MCKFSKHAHETHPTTQSCDYAAMYTLIIQPVSAEKVIASLKLSSAPGCELTNAMFLKNTNTYCSVLTKVFQQLLDKGSLPDWKEGKVIPLHKTGTKHSLVNYRLITLTSIPCKLFRAYPLFSYCQFLRSKLAFFSEFQHGFRKTYSLTSIKY